MDLEAMYGGFSEDPSFLMESLHGVSSSPKLRGRRSLNNGDHGGRNGDMQGYGRSNTQEALGCDGGSFQGRKKGESADGAALFCPIICGNSGLSNKATLEGSPVDKARNQGRDKRSSQAKKKEGNQKMQTFLAQLVAA
ncbi:hypothetical protein F0562_010622 [Nyssa sinensis]|uniref:Uncharacterized protein n=1 Tax=Nyssa sinensis TaxID=561372 RepID=A0A5J5A1N6_9ASTE|nr:hypothetical protein F0562_010622 [Nyssa sinensis]